MADHKTKFFYLFLLFGTFVLVSKVELADGKACTRECDGRIAFGICPFASDAGVITKKIMNLEPICTNCCAGKKGCKYFSADGTFICEGESEYATNNKAVENNNNVDQKACTKECDGRIAFGICPFASDGEIITKRINLEPICTNCCAGKKGCKYFSADGKFICEGESEYVTNINEAVENKNNVGCTKECDRRIAFGICPFASDGGLITKRINLEPICTNCCAGKKGCKYFSADGTFICDGETEYVSNMENHIALS